MDLKLLSTTELINELESGIEEPEINLPLPIFHFVNRIATLTNIDILVKDLEGNIALSWRDDDIFGHGWHVPGRIIRYQNTIEKTLNDCLRLNMV